MPQSTAHIKKTPKGFRVRYYANNGELLAVSEIVNSLANAKKNIKAMRKLLKDGVSYEYNGLKMVLE